MKMKILYEDKYIIAVNKPAGLLSIATDKEKIKTAYHEIREYAGRIFVVHRLDRDTSGVFLVAKDEKTKRVLQDNWNPMRGYTAIVEGALHKKNGRIETFLRETKTHFIYSAPSGQKAITTYNVLEESSAYSLVSINIETGRKNQIRVHMSELGHPIAGDKKYGAKTNPLRRLGLHAHILEFIHPVTGQLLAIKAPVPFNLKSIRPNPPKLAKKHQ